MTESKAIKNIIFDLGGVLLDLNPMRTIEAFERLGLSKVIGEGAWSYHHPVFLKMEKGELSDDEFRNGVRELLPQPKSDEEINAAWCAMLLAFPAEKIELLMKLRQTFGLYLFSNTNNIHLEYFRKLFRESFNFELDSLFAQSFYSHKIGLRKPDVASYKRVVKSAGIDPRETLFIDDSKMNIEGALKAGLNAIHYEGKSKLEEVLSAYF